VSELNEHAEEMPSHPVANTAIAVATRYLTTCKSVRSHSEALYEGAATVFLAEIRQFTCQTTQELLADPLSQPREPALFAHSLPSQSDNVRYCSQHFDVVVTTHLPSAVVFLNYHQLVATSVRVASWGSMHR
jgi:hypothetical protein